MLEIGTTVVESPGQLPVVGRKPQTPLRLAGMRTEPAVSPPMPAGAMRAATAAAGPPLLPPAMRVGS